jgi:hypothetical protein
MMGPKTESYTWFLLRLFKPSEPNKFLFARKYSGHREWYLTEDLRDSFRFHSRSDARRTTRTVNVRHQLQKGYFWEVVKVVETREISFEVETLVSNAPPLYQLARAAE